jgi:hypothetical protein
MAKLIMAYRNLGNHKKFAIIAAVQNGAFISGQYNIGGIHSSARAPHCANHDCVRSVKVTG